MSYNGWSNYETWVVNAWLTNDEYNNSELTYMAQDVHEKSPEHASARLSESIRAMVEESAPELGASMYADLLRAAMDTVNWIELAEYYLEDVEVED